MASITQNTIVIHDADLIAFNVWLFMMCAVLLAYFIVTTIHDIRREQKLEELKKKYEQKAEKHNLEDI